MAAGPFIAMGVDPGFANFGYCVARIGAEFEYPIAAGVITTQKIKTKQAVYAADDNLRRTQEIAAELSDIIATYGVTCLTAESMSHPRHAAAAAKVALSWGVIGTFLHLLDLPIVSVTPKNVKKAVTGNASASKEDVEDAMALRWPQMRGLLTQAESLHNHAYDAAATIVAASTSDVMRAMRKGRA